MNRALSQRLLAEVPRRLADLVGVPQDLVKVRQGPAESGREPSHVDMLVSVGGHLFVAECKTSGEAASVTMASRQLQEYRKHSKRKAIPLVVVPYMGEVGQRLCDEAGTSWLDLSGNAHLFGPPGLRVHVEGKPNLFKRPGRPRSVFAPKSSRITRCLLTEPDRAFSQRELANTSGLDEGFTSRIVRQLEEKRLLVRDANGAVKVADFDMMLDAWHEAYDFSRHHIVRGHVAARSSDEVLRRLAGHFKGCKAEHAVTGLAGAWLLNKFAGFRLVVFYVDEMPSAEALQEIGFREEPRGENVWLVVPNDEGVFYGAVEREGIRCVNPVQMYLDLKNHPERSVEAAAQLRQKLLRRENRA